MMSGRERALVVRGGQDLVICYSHKSCGVGENLLQDHDDRSPEKRVTRTL